MRGSCGDVMVIVASDVVAMCQSCRCYDCLS